MWRLEHDTWCPRSHLWIYSTVTDSDLSGHKTVCHTLITALPRASPLCSDCGQTDGDALTPHVTPQPDPVELRLTNLVSTFSTRITVNETFPLHR